MSSTQVQLIGFDTAGLTSYWKVRDSRSADGGEAEFIRGPLRRERLSCRGGAAMPADIFPGPHDVMPSVRQRECQLRHCSVQSVLEGQKLLETD